MRFPIKNLRTIAVAALVGISLPVVAGVVSAGAVPSTYQPSIAIPVPSDAASPVWQQAFATSCPSATTCYVLGAYQDTSGNDDFFIATYVSGVYTSTSNLSVDPSLDQSVLSNGADGGLLSCSAVGECTAIAMSVNGEGYFTEHAGTWANGQLFDPTTDILSLSCPSATTCVGVGADGNGNAALWSEDTGTWTLTSSTATPANAAVNAQTAMESVSCWSDGNCTAVGIYELADASVEPMVMNMSSGVWGSPTQIQWPSAPAAGSIDTLTSISCSGSGDCVAGGTDDAGAAIYAMENAGTWQNILESAQPSDADPTQGSTFDSVSCFDSTDCVLIGTYYLVSGVSVEFTLSGNPAATSSSGAPHLSKLNEFIAPYDSMSDPASTSAVAYDISCSAAATCFSVGNFSPADGSAHALVTLSGLGVPSEPTSVAVTAKDSSLDVSWSAPVSAGLGITGYSAIANDGTNNFTCTTTLLTCTISGLTNGTAYNVYVHASSSAGDGPSALPVAGTPTTPPPPPAAPTNVAASAGNSLATISWTPGNANGLPITGYSIGTTWTGHSTPTFVNCPPATTTSCVKIGLTNGVTYSFVVVEKTASGSSSPSSSASATPAAKPSMPFDVQALPVSGALVVSWYAAVPNGASVTTYKVTAGTKSCSTATLTCTVSGLTNGTAYVVTVVATNAMGAGPTSLVVIAKPSSAAKPKAPSAVRTLTATSTTANSAVLKWKKPFSPGEGVLRYSIWRSSDNVTFTNVTSLIAGPIKMSYRDASESSGHVVYLRVFAIGKDGQRSLGSTFKVTIH